MMSDGVHSKVGKAPKAILDARQPKGNLRKGKFQIKYSNLLFYLWIWVCSISDAKPMTQNESLDYLGIYENTYPSSALASMEWVNSNGCGSMGDFHSFIWEAGRFGECVLIFALRAYPTYRFHPVGKTRQAKVC